MSPVEQEAARLIGLSGRVAVVTGESGDLGRAIVATLQSLGATVVGLDIQPPADGGAALSLRTDVTRSDEVESAFCRVREELGRVDILVNSAGLIHRTEGVDTILGETEEIWDRVLSVNLKGAFLCSRAALPSLIERPGGRVVNITSIIVKRVLGTVGASYGASKGGLANLTKSLAVQGAPYGMTANAVAPHALRSGMLTSQGPEAEERIAANVPLRRLCAPEEVAYAVTFLASPAAAFITGQTLHVNGGVMMVD